MTVRIGILASLLLLNASANAQQPPPSPEVQAIGNRLLQEIQTGIQCSANAITLQQELEKARAEIKRLTPSPPVQKK